LLLAYIPEVSAGSWGTACNCKSIYGQQKYVTG
jgi:hypothetical protein